MPTSFAKCRLLFENNQTNIDLYSYRGRVRGTLPSDTNVITEHGCNVLCGTSPDYYSWATAASTITTWVLPIIGLLLQAPYESNHFRQTIYALCRWIGNPMASLSYILWNIKVSGKCALMLDMATAYDKDPINDPLFGQLRDSLAILSVMNQYKIKPNLRPGSQSVQAERLLRVALFSTDIYVPGAIEPIQDLRANLARSLRSNRRRGVVPVFISIMWFVFSLGISVQAAFGQLGENQTAHNLAIGLLLGWLPILILCSIVDRNPVAADDVCKRLNKLVARVRDALEDPSVRKAVCKLSGGDPDMYVWTNSISSEPLFAGDFFTDFVGQGRTRWHYGVAHPILAGIEANYVAERGRGWLQNDDDTRMALLNEPRRGPGLLFFDIREFWQIIGAVAVVAGCCLGAFVLSYFTPTEGLGCRSGGYLIFCIIAVSLLIAEMTIWFTTYRESLMRVYANRILRLVEAVNASWLVYIIAAQTLGAYRKCSCMASTWGLHGGYIDFESSQVYRAHGVVVYWAVGTGVSCAVMVVAMGFIVAEWCEQSHLNTGDYAAAMRGLQRTRRWKRSTSWVRHWADKGIHSAKTFKSVLLLQRREGRSSLVWST
ncbi:MAG: hypothetical protein M1817_002588 [Caeruleum heppii]|nr:MAG: hypothetical protein M1817_002588 [Caeruleum heppii]